MPSTKIEGMKKIGLIGGMSWESTALYYQHINREVARRRAQGVILGCAELTMSLQPGDGGLPGFDTTALHAMAAVDFCLS